MNGNHNRIISGVVLVLGLFWLKQTAGKFCFGIMYMLNVIMSIYSKG